MCEAEEQERKRKKKPGGREHEAQRMGGRRERQGDREGPVERQGSEGEAGKETETQGEKGPQPGSRRAGDTGPQWVRTQRIRNSLAHPLHPHQSLSFLSCFLGWGWGRKQKGGDWGQTAAPGDLTTRTSPPEEE